MDAEANEGARLLPAQEQRGGGLDDANLRPEARQANGILWKRRSVLEAILLAVTTALYMVTLVVNGFAAFAEDPEQFGFKHLTGNVSANYFTDITPADWVFAIWGVIYLWQAAWLAWAWTFPCRRHAVRTISIPMFLSFGLSCACNITWVYLWGNVYVRGALAVIILFALSLIVSVACAAYKTASIKDDQFVSWKDNVSKWVTYVLVHNGLALYTTWLCIAWLLNMTVVADSKYDFGGVMKTVDAGTLALSFLVGEIIVWFLLEQTFFERYVRYIHTIYPVIIVALVSVVVKHWNIDKEDSRNHIFALGILVLAGILQMARFAFVIVKYCVRKRRHNA